MKKLLIALGLLVVLVVTVALVAPFFIPTETITGRLVAAVKSATGRDLKIAGPVKLSFLPRLALDATGVSFANAPGAHDADMVRLKQLEVTLRILPLLGGRVEIGRFVLDEPQIALEIDKDGNPNWVFAPSPAASTPAPPAAAAPTPAPPPAASRQAPISGLSLGDVRIANGSLSYRDDRTGKAETVESIDMKLALPDLDSPFAGDGAAVWHGQKIALQVGVAKPRALLSGAESSFQIKLAGAPLEIGFQGSLTGLPPQKLAGTVDLSVPSLRGLADWAGSPLPAGNGFQKLAIKGRVDMAGAKYSFSDAVIAFDAINAKGSFGVTTGGSRPVLTGSLDVDTLDLNPYLPPDQNAAPAAATAPGGGASSGAPAGAKAAQGWSDAPFDLAPLALADGEFDLKAGAIRYRKIELGASALALSLKDAKLAANLSQLTLYKGNGNGKVSLDGSGATPALALDFALKGVEVGPLLAAAAGTDRISGTGDVNFTVAGSGKSQRALVSALNGKGALQIANGELKGANLVALAENATSAVTGANASNSTSFGALTGTFTITNGVVKNDDLQLKSGVIPITGAGTVSLPARTLDYRIKVSVAGTIGVPVLVSGPWDDLSYRPDLAGALQGLTQAPGDALDQLKTLGGKGAGGATGVLKNLLGK